jgi:hypothetical protein
LRLLIAQRASLPEQTPGASATPFEGEAPRNGCRRRILKELNGIDLAKDKRVMFYPFGAAEGFLLDQLQPNWKKQYFEHANTLDEFFEK